MVCPPGKVLLSPRPPRPSAPPACQGSAGIPPGHSSIPVLLCSLHWQECHLLHRDQHPRLCCCPDWQGESQVPSPPTPPCQAPAKSHRPRLLFQTRVFSVSLVFLMERNVCLTHGKTPLPTHTRAAEGFMEQLKQGRDLGALLQVRTHLSLRGLDLTKC